MEIKLGISLVLKITKLVLLLLPLLVQFYINQAGVEGGVIGVNYGTVADNLPPAVEVAQFLAKSTIIKRVRLFDSDPKMVSAFSNTGIGITVTVPSDEIPELSKLYYAQQWVKTKILPHAEATNMIRILVGNEVLSTANKVFISNLVPAMQSLHAALVEESLEKKIKISTPHSLGILSNSKPPSTGKFRPNAGEFDDFTRLTYANMLDAQLDAVFAAMKRLGFADVDIAIAETGWPSRGDAGQLGVDAGSAAEYNRKLMHHVTSGVGTPLMPNRTFETYIFALFNEDLKPGPVCERNFGLFRPDFSPVYDAGILKPMLPSAAAAPATACFVIMILLHINYILDGFLL